MPETVTQTWLNGRRVAAIGPVVLLSLVGLLALLPVAVILPMSFGLVGGGATNTLSADGYGTVFSESDFSRSLMLTTALAVRVPLGVVVGAWIAWLIVRVRVVGSRIYEFTLWFIFFLPNAPLLAGWILFLDSDYGLLNVAARGLGLNPLTDIYSVGGILWFQMVTNTTPIAALLLIPAMRTIDRVSDEAARVAGASPFRIWRSVIMPAVAPTAIVAGVAGLTRAMESFEAEQILGTPKDLIVLPSLIYEYVLDETPLITEAAAVSMFFIALMIVLTVAHAWLRRGQRQIALRSDQSVDPTDAYGARYRMAAGIGLGVLFFIGAGIPIGMLIVGSFMKVFGFWFIDMPFSTANWAEVLTGRNLSNALVTTIALGLAVAIAASLLFLAVAVMLRSGGPVLRTVVSGLIWLPWAIPGIILGLAVLELSLSAPVAWLVYGSLGPLIFAMLVRDMPLAVHLFSASLGQIDPDADAAARLAGAGPLRRFFRVTAPMIAPTIVVVFLLAFSSATKDVSSLILLAPPDAMTLPILTFQYLSTGAFESAAVVGVIAAFIALVMTMLALRVMRALDPSA